MIRNRVFKSPEWGGPLTYTQDLSGSSFIGTTGDSGCSYANLNNIGGSNSTTNADLIFSTTKQKTSGFEFQFGVNASNLPQRAAIDDVEVKFKWGFTGSFGNGGSSAGYVYIKDSLDNTLYTSSKFSTSTIFPNEYTTLLYATQIDRERLENIKIVFEGTAGNGKYNNPTVQFYGATIIINYHIHEL